MELIKGVVNDFPSFITEWIYPSGFRYLIFLVRSKGYTYLFILWDINEISLILEYRELVDYLY